MSFYHYHKSQFVVPIIPIRMQWSEWSDHNLGSSNKWCYQHILLLPHCWPWWLIRCDNQWRNHQSMICKSYVTCPLRSENKLLSKQICMIEQNTLYLCNIFNIHIDRGWVKYKKIISFKPMTGIIMSSRQEFLYCCTFVLKAMAMQTNANIEQFSVIEEIKLK